MSRLPVLYLAPWVDIGGTDKGTIDWFRWMDRERFALSLITTQTSPNRRLAEVAPYAEELWALPDLMAGQDAARFILDFVADRGVEVVHVMNSRMGYELLGDLHSLPRRPRIVVQLHVEEPDRDGYVRYVTTRFGNLVDAFSVVGEHLADVVHGYGVGRDRIHVIPLGVDAEEELDPARVAPREGLEPGPLHVLYPGRLVEQKDPSLMVEAVDALRRRRGDFLVHVVGEGELEAEVRAEVGRRGLDPWVDFQPMVRDLRPWLVACDALLMTSAFEGVPLVLYEAMALGLAAVVPDLPGNREIVAPGTATIVDPRDDVEAYATALERLAADRAQTAAQGARAREHVRERFSVRAMAEAHAELYLALAPARPPAPRPAAVPPPAPEPVRLRGRPSRGTPRVSVVVPCFNQGEWLRECLASVRAQSYPDLEVLVVDDASTDPDTIAAVDELERDGSVTVLRQERNRGPSAARNRGIAAATGRYVLPVDSDNVLLPYAVERLVSQLQAAGEEVGYVYQNLQYFGNREDYFESPDFNLDALLRRNYIDTSALIDRDALRAVTFPEDVVDGHEDWDFFIALAGHGIRGEPALHKTLRYRKHGFTRSDRIDQTMISFDAQLQSRHPRLFSEPLKPRWSPALSVLAMTPLLHDSASAAALPGRLARQTCTDFELLVCGDREWDVPAEPAVRWLPGRPTAGPAQALQEGLRRARGRWILATRGDGADLFGGAVLVEQVIRLLDTDLPDAFVFADVGGHDLRPLSEEEVKGARVHAAAWTVPLERTALDGLDLPPGGELEAIAGALTLFGQLVEWRQLPAPSTPAGPGSAPLRLRLESPSNAHAANERDGRRRTPPALAPRVPVPRLADPLADPWRPVLTMLLCRHREIGGEGRAFNTSTHPPEGYALERILGHIRGYSPPGTVRLVLDEERAVAVRPRGGDLEAAELARTLGYVETKHLAGLDPLVRGRDRWTGAPLVACGPDDPLAAQLVDTEVVGYLDPQPLVPPVRVAGASCPRLLGLVRSVDFDARRHRYAVGGVPAGRGVWELGAALAGPLAGTIPLRLDGAAPPRPTAATALGWAVAPATWRGFGRATARGRAVLRRAALASRALAGEGAVPAPDDLPTAWLIADPGPGRVPLYAATHPVTGDLLLTRYRVEAEETGYGAPALLGHLLARAPQTGSLARPRTAIPWGSRFGEHIRWHLESAS